MYIDFIFVLENRDDIKGYQRYIGVDRFKNKTFVLKTRSTRNNKQILHIDVKCFIVLYSYDFLHKVQV